MTTARARHLLSTRLAAEALVYTPHALTGPDGAPLIHLVRIGGGIVRLPVSSVQHVQPLTCDVPGSLVTTCSVPPHCVEVTSTPSEVWRLVAEAAREAA
jgi:hypothetical protein